MTWNVCTKPGHPTILVSMDDPTPMATGQIYWATWHQVFRYQGGDE